MGECFMTEHVEPGSVHLCVDPADLQERHAGVFETMHMLCGAQCLWFDVEGDELVSAVPDLDWVWLEQDAIDLVTCPICLQKDDEVDSIERRFCAPREGHAS